MAKKAAKVSWRTLTRRAEKAASNGHLTVARRLRGMAAEARRDTRKTGTKKGRNLGAAKRAAQGWATRRANEIKKSVVPVGVLGDAQAQSYVQTRASPGHGEIVGGADAQTAERIVKLARRKGGTDAVQNEIIALRQIARHDGCVAADKNGLQRLIQVQETIAERIVCGFIAEFDDATKLFRGLPPDMVWSINSFTLTKIVDALNKAGYRAAGKVNTRTAMGAERGE